jgi:hypothetical protein
MIRVVADNDVEGAVLAIQRVLRSRAWRDLAAQFEITFAKLEDLGLASDASDEQVWRVSQDAGAVLLTGNRAADEGEGGLEQVIQKLGTPEHLPVITIADAKRVLRDRAYATEAAKGLLNRLEHIESLRGAGRLYIP